MGEETTNAPIITNINDGSQLPNKSKNPKTLAGLIISDIVKPKPKTIPETNEAILFILSY